ncbi:MAG: pilus assembly protein PilM [Puniceicoccales bacterium]|jgi:type IV pilus assembly protein PilM|nr:pilus assembly protein PilM [Puniceicoccales bacterium]
MSSDTSIIVNCGATHVSLSVFSAVKGGQLRLERCFVESLVYDYSDEDQWLGALAQSLRLIVSKNKLSGPARIIVPGYRLLTKSIKLTQVLPEHQEGAIWREASKQLPDAHELTWGSQVVASDGYDTHVVLFAHKISEATRFTEAVCSTGVKPVVVEAATLLDYQAFRLANELSGGAFLAKTAPLADEGEGSTASNEVLLVNIGARSTNLTFVSDGGFSIQNINLGGNQLTQAFADNTGTPFRDAERQKIEYFSNSSLFDSADPIVLQLRSQAQNFTKRLAQEISRRIINYKRASQNRAPGRILLTGRGSLLPGLREGLADSLKIPTDFFQFTSALQIRADAQATLRQNANGFQFSEAVGEAASLVLKNPVGVNLIPVEIRERIEFSKRKPFLLFAAILAALAPLPVAGHFWMQNGKLEKAERVLKGRYDDYKAILSGKDGVLDYKRRTDELLGRVEEMTAVARLKTSWFDVLRELQKVVIQDTNNAWIEAVWLERPVPLKQLATVASANRRPVPPPKPAPLKLNVKIRVLLDDVAPAATYDNVKETEKFRYVLQRLETLSFIVPEDAKDEKDKGVKAIPTNEQSVNLPTCRFVLTINPDLSL